jgi:ligand-binding sensor domain-containing protein/predicted Ser/Thr protein kinase
MHLEEDAATLKSTGHNDGMPGPLRNAVVVLAVLVSAHAASNRLLVHSNPNIRAFAIAQASDGWLWLAAADGLYRFDGFHYDKLTSFPMSSARFLSFTADGSLWIGDFQGLVRMRDGRFEHILTENVLGFAAYPNEVFVDTAAGVARIGIDGSVRRLGYRVRRDMSIDENGRLWAACIAPDRICWIDPKQPEIAHGAGDGDEFYKVIPDSKGRLWLADNERAIAIDHNRTIAHLERRPSTEGNRASPLLAGLDGRLWFLGETPREVVSGFEFRDRADHDRFAPLAGLEDSAGHLWISALGQGLVEWIRDPNWDRWFPEDFSGEAEAQVLRDRDGSMIAATQKHLYRMDGDGWKRLADKEQRYDSVAALDGGGFLAAIRDFGVAVLSSDGKVIERMPDLLEGKNQYRQIVRDAKGRYWVGAKEALLRVDGRHFVQQTLPGEPHGETAQAVDLEVDKSGRLWVGYMEGIAWLDEADQWHRIETSEPVKTVRSISVDANEIWVAYRLPGLFSRLVRNGERWNVTNYSFAPRDTYFIKRDSRGWIWRGTAAGVYVSDGKHFAQEDWLHLHMGNGLAANELDQYGFFQDVDGSVWISGEEGVTHLHPDASWFGAPAGAGPIRVTRVEADGQILQPSATQLPANLKMLRIELGTLNAPPFRDAPLRWRLRPSDAWHSSTDGNVEARNLIRGEYSLEAAYAGGEASAIFAFRVGPAMPWVSWLWLAPAAIVAPFALRRSTLAKARFGIQKSIFLLRRRLQSPAADSVPNQWSGQILNGRYRTGEIVSRGGFSVVYEARDLESAGERVAVKVLNRTTRKDGWMRDRFAHEVSALRSIDHPGVVPILDSWISPLGEPCLAMPYLAGETLRHAMGRFDRTQAAALVRRIGAALAAVHSRGIVHRDLKPENIILMKDDQPVIVDFGTAGLRSAEDELAETTLIAGSFHYMAPERLTGRYSPATDVYSFAVIILELLSGKRLADLRWSFSDSSFEDELELDLESKLAASLLAPAFDPDPRRRPGPVGEWADRVAQAIDHT